jgi:hypothetical protein
MAQIPSEKEPTMKTSIRTLRLTAATAVALVLMTGAAQARPMLGNGPAEKAQTTHAYAGTYQPVAPANNVTLAPDRVDRIGAAPQFTPQGNVPDRVDKLGTAEQHRALAPLGGGTVVVHSTSTTGGGFDWTAAGIGAGIALVIVLIVGAAGMTVRGRRGIALSS